MPSEPEPAHVPTTTPTRALAHARLTMAQLLAGDPSQRQMLAIAAALALVDQVAPPHPPLPENPTPVRVMNGVQLALDQLHAAVAEAATLADVARIGHAALELRQALPNRSDAP